MNVDVLNFVIQYKRRHDGNSPTFLEIMQGCRVSSTSMVNFYLKQLEDAGLIHRKVEGKRMSANIEVIGGRWIYIPVGRTMTNGTSVGVSTTKQEAQ